MEERPWMQELVQGAVLRMVAHDSAIHPDRLLRTLPLADERDVARAVQLLLEDGRIVVPVRPRSLVGRLAPVDLTERGRARLADDGR